MNLPPRYLNWRLIDGRKVPCRANGEVCDSHDVRNHTTLEVAQASEYGVAFDIRAEDNLFFLDLDKCRDDSGKWTAEAESIFTSFAGAWGEVSQSGKGLHIIGKCDPTRLADRRNKWDGWLEFYVTGRFIAFGGTGWAPIGGTSRPEQDWTDQLLHVVPQRETLNDLPDGIDETYTGAWSDDDLIAQMMRSGGGAAAAFGMKASVKNLWEADVAVLSRMYPPFEDEDFDHSAADAALMAHLAFWTGKDMPRMDRLFRESALMRPKWDKRHRFDGATYGRMTTEAAARLCNKVYDRPATTAKTAPASSADPDVYMTIPEMAEHFAGCTYIRDMHRVMVPDGSMLKPEQFNASYGGYLFQMMPDGTKPSGKAFEALTENKAVKFPQAIRPCFRPDMPGGHITEDGAINTYVQPNVTMKQGDVSPFLNLLSKLLPDQSDRDILLSYMAAVVQNPGQKFQWAPVLQGCEGNGKTLVFSCVAYAVGRQYVHMPSAKQLGGQFNSWLEGKTFILVEEVHMRGKLEILDALKPMVTNLNIEIEGKGIDKRMIENRSNWGFCTNYMDAVLKSQNDRRYAIFFTAHQSVADLARDGMDGGFFPALYGWLRDSCGYEMVAHYLMNYAIPEHLNPAGACHRAPTTSSTAQAIVKSMGGVESEIIEASEDNTAGFRGGWVSAWALDKLMRERGIRIARNKLPDILSNMGYVSMGRASKPIMQEDGKRPMLYKRPDVTVEYGPAQNYAG